MLYHLDAPADAIARAFGAPAGSDPWAGGYVSPGRFAPVITAGREFVAGARTERGRRRMVPRLWGVPPPPSAHDPARLVTSVANPESPFWIGNLRNSEFRCLVPATAFVEWGSSLDVEGRREQFVVTCPARSLFAMAGVWKDSEVPGFALLTCPANGTLRRLGRERMPVVLTGAAAHDTWLHGGWDRAAALIASPPDEAIQARLIERFT